MPTNDDRRVSEPSEPDTYSGPLFHTPAHAGQEISHYRIVDEIGRGGMGVVYHATDLTLERDVALKCAWPERTSDPELRQRMMREARAAARIVHANVVPVLEVFEEREVLWLVMEKVSGRSLRETLRDGTPLPASDVIRHGEGLAEALAVAHANGILHRDISPGNILVASDGRARLTDFGLVRFFLPAGNLSNLSTPSSSITAEGRAVGTLAYMSPEQTLGRETDPRSDIFSLGAVLYEATTAKRAFEGASNGEVIDAILHREPAAMSRFGYGVPAELDRIVFKAMAKRPDERYQSAPELAADLRALRRRVESEEYLSEGRAAFPRRLRTGHWLAIAALAVSAVAVWMVSSQPPQGAPPSHPGLERPVQLTAGPGWKTKPALSPDGTSIAYASDNTGNSEIYTIDTRPGGIPLQLTNDPAKDHSPAWLLPDGSAVVFSSDRGGSEGIWKMPRFPGPAVLLLPNGADPAVSPDGTRLAFARPDGTGRTRIFVAPIENLQQTTPLTSQASGLWSHRRPAWSPDGSSIAYDAFQDLWLVAAAGGSPRLLTTNHESDREPAWSVDGRWVYFASYRGRSKALWCVPAAGGTPQRLTLGTGSEGEPSFDRSGSRVAYSTYADEPQLGILNLATGDRHTWAAPRRAAIPTFAPDGTSLYYTSDQSGRHEIWAQRLLMWKPEGQPRTLFEQQAGVGTFCLSPDGRWIAYYAVEASGERDLWIVPAQGGVPARLAVSPGADIHPAWSPKGDRIAFASDRSGAEELYILPVRDGRAAGPARRVASAPPAATFPSWASDGRAVAFVGSDGGADEAWTVPEDGSAPPRLWTRGGGIKRVLWDGSTRTLLASGTWGGSRVVLRRLRAPGATPESPARPVVFGTVDAYGMFALFRDGMHIAFVQEARRGDIWLAQLRAGGY